MSGMAVIGIGNILLRDDGLGVHALAELEKEKLPEGVELVDGGTATLNLIHYFSMYKRIIIMDSLKGGLAPGTIYKLRPEDITNYKRENLSIHDVQILDVVKMANMLGVQPDVVIYAMEPEEIRFDLEMTDTVRSRIPELVRHVTEELNAYARSGVVTAGDCYA